MAKPLLLLLGVVLGAGVLVGRADPDSSPPALPPADLAGLVVSATPERSRYLLGETVRVRYLVANRGSTPLTIRRDNDTAFWRPTSLHVTALDADTGAAVPEAPCGIDIFNYRYGRSHTLAPGETWTHDFFPLRHVELPGPGRYRFQLRHTLGWPDAATAPAAPEFTVEFAAPAPDQAAALVAALPPLGETADDAPLPVDTYGFNYPVYVAPLLRRITGGEPALIDSLDRLPVPEATAALITLATHPQETVARAALSKLLQRIPAKTGVVVTYAGDCWPGLPTTRAASAWTAVEECAARALARRLLAAELPALDPYGRPPCMPPALVAAALLAPFGDASDLRALSDALDRVARSRSLAAAYRQDDLFPDEATRLRAAFAAMHARGVRASMTPARLGEAILWFDQHRLDAPAANVDPFPRRSSDTTRTSGPRADAWLDRLYVLAGLRPSPTGLSSPADRPDYFGSPASPAEPHPALLVAALESIPAPIPPECLPFVRFAFESNNPFVIHAACVLAAEARETALLPSLQRVLATESDPWLRATVDQALVRLGDRLGAFRSLADRLATSPETGEVLDQIGSLLFAKRQSANRYTRPPLSRSARLALRDSWQTFITDHAARLRTGEPFPVGDAAIPETLFANQLAWRRTDESLWPVVVD